MPTVSRSPTASAPSAEKRGQRAFFSAVVVPLTCQSTGLYGPTPTVLEVIVRMRGISSSQAPNPLPEVSWEYSPSPSGLSPSGSALASS